MQMMTSSAAAQVDVQSPLPVASRATNAFRSNSCDTMANQKSLMATLAELDKETEQQVRSVERVLCHLCAGALLAVLNRYSMHTFSAQRGGQTGRHFV
jgi:hypothetical protein